MVWLVSFLDRADVMIERGENEGKTVAYSQIVTGPAGPRHVGAGDRRPFQAAARRGAGVARQRGVILVQQEEAGLPGRILGAASFLR